MSTSSPTAWWRARGRPTKCSPLRTRTCTSSCTRSPTGRSRFTIPAGRSARISGSRAQSDRRGKPRPRRSTVTALPSIDPDVLLADDLAPPGGFGLDELGEPLGSARDDVSALQGELVLHFLHCEEVDQGFVQLFDDRTRRARRRDQPDPGGRFETRVNSAIVGRSGYCGVRLRPLVARPTSLPALMFCPIEPPAWISMT